MVHDFFSYVENIKFPVNFHTTFRPVRNDTDRK